MLIDQGLETDTLGSLVGGERQPDGLVKTKRGKAQVSKPPYLSRGVWAKTLTVIKPHASFIVGLGSATPCCAKWLHAWIRRQPGGLIFRESFHLSNHPDVVQKLFATESKLGEGRDLSQRTFWCVD
jgi:hypothetical protein